MKTTSAELKARARQTLSGKYGLCVGAQLIEGVIIWAAFMALLGVTMGKMHGIMGQYGFGRIYGNTGLSGSLYSVLPDLGGMVILIAAAEVVFLSFISVLNMGIRRIYLNLCLGQPAGVGDMLYGFSHKMHRFIGLYFINMLVNLVLKIPTLILASVFRSADNALIFTGLMELLNLLQIVGIVVFALYFAQASMIMVEDPQMKVIASMKESARLMRGSKGDLFYLYMSFFGIICLGMLSCGVGFLWLYPYMECTSVHFYLQLRESDMQAMYEAYGDDGYAGEAGYPEDAGYTGYAGYPENDGSTEFSGQNWQ